MITYRCPNCSAVTTFTRTLLWASAGVTPLCWCRSAVMTLVSDSSVTDCGDFTLRVVPSWG